MKTAPAFHVYVLGDLEKLGFAKLLAELRIEAEPFPGEANVMLPA